MAINTKSMRILRKLGAYNPQKQSQSGITLGICGIIALAWLLCLLMTGCSFASEPINIEKLANSIYLAEGGAKTRHPYGILAKYKHTTPRQACINTIKHRLINWQAKGARGDFIAYLGSFYAPTGNIANDPTHLNDNWVRNVRYYYERI